MVVGWTAAVAGTSKYVCHVGEHNPVEKAGTPVYSNGGRLWPIVEAG
jgi:hypothetical protein